jgi:hypothetical protein
MPRALADPPPLSPETAVPSRTASADRMRTTMAAVIRKLKATGTDTGRPRFSARTGVSDRCTFQFGANGTGGAASVGTCWPS